MTDDRWQSPLGSRYASPAMQALWGERHRIGLWRRAWLALAESERELGLPIPEAALDQMRSQLDNCDLSAPRAFLRSGESATSAFITDNADVLVIRESLRLVLGRLVALLDAYQHFARAHAALPCLAYTHFQPAQLTTVGKRATLWMQELALDVE